MNKADTYTYTYRFYGDDGMLKIDDVMKMLRHGLKMVGGFEVESIQDHSQTLEYRLTGGSSVMISMTAVETEDESGAGPVVEVTISAAGKNDSDAAAAEVRIRKDLESIIYMDHGMGYCCE